MKPSKVLPIVASLILVILPASKVQGQLSFKTGPELLARPTDHSITLNVVTPTGLEAYVEYGTTSGSYPNTTATVSKGAGEPIVIVIDGLSANTKYYYRLVYSTNGGSTWVERGEHTFQTQRPAGSTFKFDVTSDSHVNILLGNAATWTQTLTNVATDNPDYLIDLGDTFAMDGVSSQATALSNYLFQRDSSFFGRVSHSASIFIVPGNHEQQEGWHLADAVGPLPVWATNAQKRYFPNPVPNDFYTGNTDTYYALDGDQLHEDYYAWTWGDALFVAIDPFWYTIAKPFVGNTGGGEPGSSDGDRWHWTLGDTQYWWLKNTLENSTASFKFLFMHHPTGGTDDYIRGGAAAGTYCEWGGYNEDGTTWGFTTRRPTWPKPIHQILVDNNVSAVFHGHDHQYAYEKRDGIVYQELPSGGFSGNGFNQYQTNVGYCIKALPSPGHLRVTVSPTGTTVEYIGTSTGAVNYSYTIEPIPLPIQMASFTASVVRNNDVEVAWKTVSETNNYGFEIYRRRGNAGDWDKIGFVKGHGTTLAAQSYSYVDRPAAFGKYYYRIKQVDLDGKSETFPEMEVAVGTGPDKFVLGQNYPNPFNPRTVIEFVVPKSGFARLKVYNVLGQEVATLFEGNAEAGRINTALFNASSLPSGVYFYTLKSAGQTETKPMLLTK
jgi:3',5'-cyclic AMP phosphodiesterase CpdA